MANHSYPFLLGRYKQSRIDVIDHVKDVSARARGNSPCNIVEARRVEFICDQRKLQFGLLRFTTLISRELRMELHFPVLPHTPLCRDNDLRNARVIKCQVGMRFALALRIRPLGGGLAESR